MTTQLTVVAFGVLFNSMNPSLNLSGKVISHKKTSCCAIISPTFYLVLYIHVISIERRNEVFYQLLEGLLRVTSEQ